MSKIRRDEDFSDEDRELGTEDTGFSDEDDSGWPHDDQGFDFSSLRPASEAELRSAGLKHRHREPEPEQVPLEDQL